MTIDHNLARLTFAGHKDTHWRIDILQSVYWENQADQVTLTLSLFFILTHSIDFLASFLPLSPSTFSRHQWCSNALWKNRSKQFTQSLVARTRHHRNTGQFDWCSFYCLQPRTIFLWEKRKMPSSSAILFQYYFLMKNTNSDWSGERSPRVSLAQCSTRSKREILLLFFLSQPVCRCKMVTANSVKSRMVRKC